MRVSADAFKWLSNTVNQARTFASAARSSGNFVLLIILAVVSTRPLASQFSLKLFFFSQTDSPVVQAWLHWADSAYQPPVGLPYLRGWPTVLLQVTEVCLCPQNSYMNSRNENDQETVSKHEWLPADGVAPLMGEDWLQSNDMEKVKLLLWQMLRAREGKLWRDWLIPEVRWGSRRTRVWAMVSRMSRCLQGETR